MADVVNWQPSPTRYHGDLIHDGAWIERNKPKSFWWVLRESGTQIGRGKEGLETVIDVFEDILSILVYRNKMFLNIPEENGKWNIDNV